MRISQLLLAACLGLGVQLAQAEPEQAIRQSLIALQPNLAIESIAKSPLEGLYQVQLKGGRVLYASGDGQFVMQGYLYQVKDGKASNLTEKAENVAVARQINGLDRNQMIVYPAQGETKAHITVFTDTTCPYCQKLHAEVPELNRQGIEVRYLAFPRQGLGSEGDQQLQAAWCATDRRAALNKLIEGKSVDAAKCANPVSKQFALGQSIGVSGTPAIVLQDGQVIPGYQPAAQVAKVALAAQ